MVIVGEDIGRGYDGDCSDGNGNGKFVSLI